MIDICFVTDDTDGDIVVVGPRYVEDDFQLGWINCLSKHASGVQGQSSLSLW